MKSYLLRRKNYLINKDFQLRYIGKILFGIVIMALIMALTVYYTTWARIMDAFHHLPEIASQYATLFWSVNQAVLIISGIFLLAAGITSVFVSHSIAGPMFRVEKAIETITNGDFTLCVGLRKNDEFRYLADKLNEMISGLRSRVSQERVLILDISDLAAKLKEVSGKKEQSLPEFKALIEKIETLARQNTEHFKLPG